MKSILFFGDSNTWGFDPHDSSRYPYDIRWTSICRRILGDGYDCIPSGMNGRTAAQEDPSGLFTTGLATIKTELATHKPLDLLVIALGTNDLKYTDAEGSADGVRKVIEWILNANRFTPPEYPLFTNGVRILLISPIRIIQKFDETTSGEELAESEKLPQFFKELAEEFGTEYLDASLYASPSDVDGIHMDPEGHEALGKAVAAKIRSIFE